MAKTLHMVLQHQLLGIGMQIHLLVHPVGHWIAVQGRALRARPSRSRHQRWQRLLQLACNGVRLLL
jgi:hypothetical protein